MMKIQFGLGFAALVLAAACHRGSSTMQREQKNYAVVSEGQASGVSSTINAPGETPPPMTNTSADTTSNFTLTPNVDTTGTVPPGSLAGTLPVTTTVPPAVRPTAPPPPRVITTTQPQQPSRIVITNTNPQTEFPPPPKKTKQPAPPPEQTDTSATTTAPPPEQTDTTSTDDNPPPPPPPTQTDTRGW
jgi:tRNA(adenine34) deaminase